jgi:hypothetical protein
LRRADQATRIASTKWCSNLKQRLVGDEESVKTLPVASCSIALSYLAHTHVSVLADGVELGVA